MGTKKGDEKFGHALHDDLTRSAIYKKMEQKAIEGNRRVHVSRRAWKYRIDDDESEKETYMKRCAYVSRRTQLACKNYRLPTQLSREGFCEVHTRFFQQLAQQAAAEQRRIDKILLKKTDNILSTADDDETLMTVTDWSSAQHELFNNLFLDDDDDNLLKNAGVWTDEEVLHCQLVALERKLRSIREFRRMIAEKARRLAVTHAKMEEDPKKGKPKVGKDKRTQELQLANKRYHSSHSAKDQYMSRRLKARLEWDGSEEHRLDYLKVDDMEGSRCAYFLPEDADIQKGDQLDNLSGTNSFEKGLEEDHHAVVSCLMENLCEQVGKTVDCGKDPSECALNTENEESGKGKRRQCSNRSLPKLNFCIKHIYNDSRQHLFAPCLECNSLGLDFGDGRNYCLTHFSKREHHVNDTVEQWETRTVQQGIVPMSNIYAIKGTIPAEQLQSPVRSHSGARLSGISVSADSGNFGDGSKETSMKYVVIDEGIDERDGISVKTSTPTIGTMKHSTDAFMQPGVSTHRSWQEEEVYSCARTRPFTTENFNKPKMRRGIGVRYSLPDVKDYLSGDLLSSSVYRSQEQISKSMVHDLLSGGPSKVAASASQFAARRIVTPATSFTPKIATRRTVYSPATGRTSIEAPEMISLAPATGATTSLSTGLTPSRPIMQRPIVLRSRTGTSSTVPGQPSRLPPVSTNRYVATVGVSRPPQNYRNRATISLDSRIRRAVNVISPMDYSNRPGNNSSTSRVIPGSYFRQRDERQFISGNARSRLVAIDSLPYTAPRVYSRPSLPPPTLRPEIPRQVVYRPRVAPERKAPLTAETLETAAAVASIAADLEASEDKEDEADEILETPAWQRSIIEKPTATRDFISEHRAATGSGGRIMRSEAAESSNKQSVASLSRQSSGESAEDGLAVLAMAAASRAVDSNQSPQPPLKKSKYDQIGLEEEDDD